MPFEFLKCNLAEKKILNFVSSRKQTRGPHLVEEMRLCPTHVKDLEKFSSVRRYSFIEMETFFFWYFFYLCKFFHIHKESKISEVSAASPLVLGFITD